MGGSKLFIDSDDGSRIFGEICDRQQSQEKEEAAQHLEIYSYSIVEDFEL